MKKLIVLLAVVLIAACGGSSTPDTTTPDDTSPDVTAPADSINDEPASIPTEASAAEPEDAGTTPEENLDQVFVPTTVIYIIGAQDGEFLGVINTNSFDTYSICNSFSNYGSKFSTISIWNTFGSYGSDYATNSAFNEFTQSPPIIYEYYPETDTLIPIFYLTTNHFKIPYIDTLALFYDLQASGCNIDR